MKSSNSSSGSPRTVRRPHQPARRGKALRQELADVFAYLLRLADVTGIDLEEALAEKIELNRHRYPVDLAYGRAEKYTKLGA